ncbi:hypothetical protein PYCC9005_001359 [Savitreella phatthalungensis]
MSSDTAEALSAEIIDALNDCEEEFSAADVELLRRQNELLAPIYAKRDALFAKIPSLWSVVFEGCDELDGYVTAEDAEVISHLGSLECIHDDQKEPRTFTLKLTFNSACTYFSEGSGTQGKGGDYVLEKRFRRRSDDDSADSLLVSEVVEVAWAQGRAPKSPSFFDLFAFTGFTADKVTQRQSELEELANVLAQVVYPDALELWTDAIMGDEDVDGAAGEDEIDEEEPQRKRTRQT